jgi:tetratricopeptide (TPR) repeat protein
MIKRAYFIIPLLLISCADVYAANAVNFLIAIHQKDPATSQKVLLYSDSAVIVKGVPASAFLTGFSADIEIVDIDSITVSFNVHIVTLSGTNNTIAKRFKCEYELPAIIDDIEVKKNSFYSITLVPKERTNFPDRICGYNHNSGSEFSIYPSANFDLHHLRNSLASFHAVAIKNLIEGEYRLFRGLFHFNVTSKQDLFAFPCEAPSVIWDKRFGTAFDPARNNCYTLYATGLNTTDPFVMIHSAVLRSYGYAPPFLSEGFANYFSLAIHNMKKIKKAGRHLPLADLLNTKTYLNSDATMADVSSATFVRYLIDTYSADVFKKLYAAADDLNIKAKIESTYSKSIAALEREWLNYVDTLTIPVPLYSEFAARAEQMLNFPLALEYRQVALSLATTKTDSLIKLEQLVLAYFFNGDYFNAAASQKLLHKMSSKNESHLIGLAGYDMMNGEYDEALKNLKAARAGDSADAVLRFNLGLNYLCQGDTAGAQREWNNLVHDASVGQLNGESRIMLGLVLRNSGNLADKQQAQDLFTIGIALFNQQMQADPSIPNPYMWTGIALLGLNDADNSYDQLTQALFLESRPFYRGMINLWLGKAADLRGKRDLARKHYADVIAGAAAAYHHEEALKYLENGYHQ